MVLREDRYNRGWLQLYNTENTDLLVSTSRKRNKADYDIPFPRCITVNTTTDDIIVSHMDGLTAFTHPDLTPPYDSGLTNRLQQDICVDGSGKVVLLDKKKKRLVYFSSDGVELHHLSTELFIDDIPVCVNFTPTEPKQQVMASECGQIYIFTCL